MTDPTPETALVLPEVFDWEGELWFAKGHVPPTEMILAVLAEVAVHGGPTLLYEMVTNDYSHPAEFKAGEARWTPTLERVATMVDSVRHYWAVPDPNNEEAQQEVEEGHPGAEAWTMVEP